ncbi:hypothetical protein [Microbacterium luteum]|uniref:hypothetical protein n=1 Tax=Microbacterium luteum TaxID=2782167 RepID=UPI001887B5E0|nr:hypothetical protein [Microbacterium luteum]
MRTRLLAPAVLAIVLLTGCASGSNGTGSNGTGSSDAPAEAEAPPAEPLDLTGEWKQINSNDPESYQQATISGDTISVDWVNDAESTTAIYWIGSYEAPTEDVDSFSWTSAGDIAAMENAILASQSDTKDFAYEDGKLTYELTAMGVTITVEMEKQ